MSVFIDTFSAIQCYTKTYYSRCIGVYLLQGFGILELARVVLLVNCHQNVGITSEFCLKSHCSYTLLWVFC